VEVFWEVFCDSLLDTLKLLPFLVIIYILIELIEQKTSIASENGRLKGNLGVLVGSATGLIPQCGFSVMAAKLYEGGFIAAGTLLAIFISTSDEAFIILLSSGQGALTLLPLILVKAIIGVAVGYAVNGVSALRKKRAVKTATTRGTDGKAVDKADYHARVFRQKEEGFCTFCGRDHDEKHPALTYGLFPTLHSLKIAAYIFLVTFAFGLLVALAGEENIVNFLNKGAYVQPFITAAIGLIPNCASSVIITQSFLLGKISFASCVAGLCTNAGLGVVVLLKNTKRWKRNLLLIVGLYLVGVLSGVLLTWLQSLIGGFLPAWLQSIIGG
jgi:hypothetical protein